MLCIFYDVLRNDVLFEVLQFSLFIASTGFTLNNLSGTAATTTTASTGLSLGGALTGLGGSLFQGTSTASSGKW